MRTYIDPNINSLKLDTHQTSNFCLKNLSRNMHNFDNFRLLEALYLNVANFDGRKIDF